MPENGIHLTGHVCEPYLPKHQQNRGDYDGNNTGAKYLVNILYLLLFLFTEWLSPGLVIV